MLKSIVAESYHDSPVENKNGKSNTPMESSRAADHHIVPKHEIRTIINAIIANQRFEKVHFFG